MKLMLKNIKILLFVFISLIGVINCKSVSSMNYEISLHNKNHFINPKNPNFTLEIFRDKYAKIVKDNFDKTHVVLVDNKETFVLKFIHKLGVDEEFEDQGQEELIYLSINNNLKKISLTNDSLTEVGAIFGRLCFCKEDIGYYPIERGKLNFKKSISNQFHLTFSFQIDNIQQNTNSINAKFSF